MDGTNQESPSSRLLGTLWDLLKAAPACVWLVVCACAVPVYAKIGWITPIMCSILFPILCLLASADIIQYWWPNMARYSLLESLEEKRSRLEPRKARIKVAVAAFFSLASMSLSATFLAVAYAVIEPLLESEAMPCGGQCDQECQQDPFCNSWALEVQQMHPAAKICPPPSNGSANQQFSCLADGYWMMVTSFISLVWLAACIVILRTANASSRQAGRSDCPDDNDCFSTTARQESGQATTAQLGQSGAGKVDTPGDEPSDDPAAPAGVAGVAGADQVELAILLSST